MRRSGPRTRPHVPPPPRKGLANPARPFFHAHTGHNRKEAPPLSNQPATGVAVTHLTTRQLAERWHVSVGHLQNLRSAGIGPDYFKPLPSRVLYSLAVIEAYEASRNVPSAA